MEVPFHLYVYQVRLVKLGKLQLNCIMIKMIISPFSLFSLKSFFLIWGSHIDQTDKNKKIKHLGNFV